MHLALFCHSIVSDWNHGNAHFLRGVTRELLSRGHRVSIFEPVGAWSRRNLVQDHGRAPVRAFRARYPGLRSRRYRLDRFDPDRMLDSVDVVLVHEWSDPALVGRLGWHRRRTRAYRLFFHDTHHRSVTVPEAIGALDLSGYDGVLAFGRAVREQYLRHGWAERAWVWHEAADVRLFRPIPAAEPAGDVVWIGNWGDEERTAELYEFFVRPVRELGLRARAHGVRYPEAALRTLARSGIEYAGWLPNFEVPEAFARHRVTVHIPRRPYLERLAGVPTIRMFEALACGIPTICAGWRDAEGLFREGRDYLTVRDGREMRGRLRSVLSDPELRRALAESGRETVLSAHTCAHRVDELFGILEEAGAPVARRRPARRSGERMEELRA